MLFARGKFSLTGLMIHLGDFLGNKCVRPNSSTSSTSKEMFVRVVRTLKEAGQTVENLKEVSGMQGTPS